MYGISGNMQRVNSMEEVLLAMAIVCWLIGMIVSIRLIYKSTHNNPCESCSNLLWYNTSEALRYTCKKHGMFYRAPKYCSNYEKKKTGGF